MNLSLRTFFASLIVIGGLAVVSFAQEGENKPKGINDRQHNQKSRIKDGVQDGDINNRELGRLTKEQFQISRMERRLRNTGDEFTKKERVRVQHQLNQSNRHIRRASKN